MSSTALTHASEVSLLDAATRLAGAERWGNVEVLQELIAPEYRGWDVSGRMQDRTSLLSAYARGTMRLAALRLSELQTKVVGNVGLVAGISQVSGRLGVEQRDLRLRFLDVYTWVTGGWRLVASQHTPLAG
jgi:ketosteroid isomerase-like protein